MAPGRKHKSDQSNLESRPTFKNKPMPFEHLPLNIFLKVINYLPIAQWPHLERVNRTFRDIIYKSWLSLKKIRLAEDLVSCRRYQQPESPEWMEAILCKLLLRAPNLIDIGGFDQSYDEIEDEEPPKSTRKLLEVLARFEKLQRLEFPTATKSNVLNFLLNSHSRGVLRHLVMGRKHHFDPPRTIQEGPNQENLVPMQLESIDFDYDWDLAQWILDDNDASRLKSLTVQKPIYSNLPFLLNLLNLATNLEHLCLCFGVCPFQKTPNHTVSERNQICTALAELSHLKSLAMNCACMDHSRSDIELLEQINRRGLLKELTLGERGAFGRSEMLNFVANTFSNLTSFNWDPLKSDNAAVERVLTAQRSLIKVRLYTWDGQELSIPIIPYLFRCVDTLKSLHLEFTVKSMTKDDLLLIASFKGLEELKISSWTRPSFTIDDSVLASWCGGFGPQLKSLEIMTFERNKVTDAGLVAFLSKTPRLRRLQMACAYMLAISDVALKEIPRLCPNLLSLILVHCGKMVTTTGLQVIINECSLLKSIIFQSPYVDIWFLKRLKIPKYKKISISVKQT